MKLNCVTITGADKSVAVTQLADLSQKYRFVEWGVLVSTKRYGTPRFPPRTWLSSLREWQEGNKENKRLKLCLHLCGEMVRNLIAGDRAALQEVTGVLPIFDRVQLNFHPEPHQVVKESLVVGLEVLREKQVIFQFDGTPNEALFFLALEAGFNVAPLFDKSGGAGVVPDKWPESIRSGKELLYCGYAGGLNPDTLPVQLPLIAKAAGDARVWVDMEQGVRSRDDKQFDLVKVERCLQLCSGLIS